MTAPTEHSCFDCGFLSIRARTVLFSDHREVFEAGLEARQRGLLFQLDNGHPTVEPQPYCFVGERDILALVRKQQGDLAGKAEGQSQAVLKVISTVVRGCPKWFGHIPNLSPQEHLARYDVQQLERRRQEWEASEAAARRAWEADQERARQTSARELHESSASLQRELAQKSAPIQVAMTEATVKQANATVRAARWQAGAVFIAAVGIVVSLWIATHANPPLVNNSIVIATPVASSGAPP